MAMEESGEYRVTRSKGRGPGRKIRKVIFRHLDEAPARRFYKRTPPAPRSACCMDIIEVSQ